jgi:DNA-binding MarR family transcriptional regulator
VNELFLNVHAMNGFVWLGGKARMQGDTRLNSRNKSDDEIVLSVLDVVERDPSVTQRSVARELGIALGLANAYLKRCVRKGLIKVSQVPPRRYAYYLTPQGFAEKSQLTAAYLAHSFSFFRRARQQCATIFITAASRGQRRIALLGASDLAEIAVLVAGEHPVEILGTIQKVENIDRLREELASLGRVDASIVTTLDRSRVTFDAAIALLGAERVYAPELLRLPQLPNGSLPVEAA